MRQKSIQYINFKTKILTRFTTLNQGNFKKLSQ